MIEALLHFNSFTNIMAIGFVFFGAAKPHVFAEDTMIRLGAMVACFGLLGQTARNTEFFLTGISPTDTQQVYWMLKDFGLFLMILGYAMRSPLADTFKKKD